MAHAQVSIHPIASIYRIVFKYLEPLLAFGGIIQFCLAPKAYLDIATPRLSALLEQQPLFRSSDALLTLYTQIWGGWCIIVFNDLVTLRIFERDVKVWRCVLAAHLMSDIVYSWALWQDRGSETWNYKAWDALEWFTVVTTIVPMLLKFTFIAGLGVKESADIVTATAKKQL